MKKRKLLTLFIFSILLLTGCKKGDMSLSARNYDANTIYVGKNGVTETVIVEDFDKDYYNKSALENYINEEILSYNNIYGEDSVKLNLFEVKDNKVKAAFTYKDMDTYASFSRMDAKYMTVEEADDQGLLPQTLLQAKEGNEVDKSEVIGKGDYKVVILNEKYDVIVDGKIKYYSGAIPINGKTVEITGEETSVIVFKQ